MLHRRSLERGLLDPLPRSATLKWVVIARSGGLSSPWFAAFISESLSHMERKARDLVRTELAHFGLGPGLFRSVHVWLFLPQVRAAEQTRVLMIAEVDRSTSDPLELSSFLGVASNFFEQTGRMHRTAPALRFGALSQGIVAENFQQRKRHRPKKSVRIGNLMLLHFG